MRILKFENAAVREAVIIGAMATVLIASVGTATAVGRHSAPSSAPVGCASAPGLPSAPVGEGSAPVGKKSGPVGCQSAPVKVDFKMKAKVDGKKTAGETLQVRAGFDNRGKKGVFTFVTTVKNAKGKAVLTKNITGVTVGKRDSYTQTFNWRTEGLAAGKYTISQEVLVDGTVVDHDAKTATVELKKAGKR